MQSNSIRLKHCFGIPLVDTESYILKDNDAQKKFSFSMETFVLCKIF